MQLFERVKFLSKKTEEKGQSLAENIGVNAHTFRGYLSLKRQDNLWPLLEKILAEYPEISRRWLYFGEGPLLACSDDLDNEAEQELLDELARLRKEVLALREGRTPEQSRGSVAVPVRQLEIELEQLRKEKMSLLSQLTQSQNEVIALYKEREKGMSAVFRDVIKDMTKDDELPFPRHYRDTGAGTVQEPKKG